MVSHRTIQVDGLSVFYREAGDPANPKLLLLGGFPASSHQFRNLIPALADRFHVLSPDYPGFGNTDMPDDFEYTFDRLSEIVEGLLIEIGFRSVRASTCRTTAARSATASSPPPGVARVAGHPELQHLRGGLHRRLGRHPPRALGRPQPRDGGAARCRSSQLDGVKLVYTHGHRDPSASAPTTGTWTSISSSGPARASVQLDLLYDYRTNVELYPSGRRSSASTGRRR